MKYIITPPEREPITLEDAKTYLRVPHDEEDNLIENLIKVSRETVENMQNRAIPEQTINVFFDKAEDEITLPRPPLKEIKSFKIDGEEFTDYKLDDKAEPSKVYIEKDIDVEEKPNLIEIEYTAGYDNIPKPTEQAIYLLIAHLYEVRGIVTDGQINEIPFTVQSLINQNKCYY